MRKKKKLNDLPTWLRGLSNNRYGGHQTQHMRGFRGSKYGPASECKTLPDDEKQRIEKELKEKGII